jgi:hypothetical protein
MKAHEIGAEEGWPAWGRIDASGAGSRVRVGEISGLWLRVAHAVYRRRWVSLNFRFGRIAGVLRDRFNGRSRRRAEVADRGLGRLSWAESGPCRRTDGAFE